MDIRRRMLLKKRVSSGGGSTTGGSYTVNLNSQWETTTAVPNPDSALYDGVYRSSSNYNVNSGVSTMYITIKDCSSFKMYIRSYAESTHDYVMVSQLDKTINGNTTYNDTTLVKAHTNGNQQPGTALSSYTLVEFTGISSGEHTITVVYRKDGSVNSGDDRGYVLIEKMQDSSGDDEGGSSEEPINIDNYLTIEARENGLTASLSTNTCEYCVDGDGNWKTLSADTATESINSGQTLSFRGELTPITAGANQGIGKFTISKKCNLKGNCMSMLFGDNAVNNYSLSDKCSAFVGLFYNCTNIVNVSSGFLPATTLASNCYHEMFYRCTSLTSAPELPATTLARSCYYFMFSGCTRLTSAPALPATTLASYCYSNMFRGCTSLTSAPALPATTLADYCYYEMFSDCTSLATTPSLPATTLEGYCYMYMFSGCTSLITAPSLPATTLAKKCYEYMFEGCRSLTTAPELPATTLAEGCYSNMFRGCTRLTSAPALPATTLERDCYEYMFSGCTSLITAPALPATTLAEYCYDSMFEDCTSLTTAPSLPATILADSCYYYMFNDCKKLNYIKMLATDISASNCLDYWVSGVASSGKFVKHIDMATLPTGDSGIPSGWTVVNDDINNYLTIEALEDGLTASLSVNACEYCVDYNGNWKTLSAGAATDVINSGQTLSFRGNLTPNNSNGIGTFTISKKCNLKGNCMSMLFGDDASSNLSLSDKSYAFYKLFYGCNKVISVNEEFLPATTLSDYCYSNMFYGCDSLTTTPHLPANEGRYKCYSYMFYGCSLITEPSPIFNLSSYGGGQYEGKNCCDSMFRNCISLQKTPVFLSGTYFYQSSDTFQYMFDGCISLKEICGTLPAIGEISYGGRGMFRNCKSLVNSPTMQDGTFVRSYAFYEMFFGCEKLETVLDISGTAVNDGSSYALAYMYKGCSSLTSVSKFTGCFSGHPFDCSYCCAGMFEDCVNLKSANLKNKYSASRGTIGNYAFYRMFANCESLTSVTLPYDLLDDDIKMGKNCYKEMFYGCTSLTTAPALPATTLAENCYYNMFYNCTSLTIAPELPATTLASDCYGYMFSGCTSLTTAPTVLPATTLASECYESMFYGCISLTTAPELTATTLADYCYGYMFGGCSKLNYIKMLATDISAINCLSGWVSGVASSGTFVKNPAMNSLPTGQHGIPSGWTVVNDGEESGGV